MASPIRRANIVRDVDPAPYAWQSLGDEPRPAAEPLPAATDRPRRPASGGYGLDQIMAEAEQIIADANAEADRLKAEAQAQAATLRDTLYHEALTRARADLDAERRSLGLDADELARAQQLFARGLAEARAAYEQALAELEARTVQAAMEVARRVIGDVIAARPEVVLDQVKDALAHAGTGELTVRVHPADMPYLQQSLLDLQKLRTGDDYITFEEDPLIERGGCVVGGPNGTIDTQPSSKLAQLRDLTE